MSKWLETNGGGERVLSGPHSSRILQFSLYSVERIDEWVQGCWMIFNLFYKFRSDYKPNMASSGSEVVRGIRLGNVAVWGAGYRVGCKWWSREEWLMLRVLLWNLAKEDLLQNQWKQCVTKYLSLGIQIHDQARLLGTNPHHDKRIQN